MRACDITGLSPTAFDHKDHKVFLADMKDLFD